jgi:hypothetical protein
MADEYKFPVGVTRASDLIEALQAMVAAHGNLPVTIHDPEFDADDQPVRVVVQTERHGKRHYGQPHSFSLQTV